MNDLLAPIFELAQPLIDLLIWALPYIIGFLLATMLLAFGYTRLHNRLIQLRQRRREWKLNGGEWHLFQPRTWFTVLPVEYFQTKADLLKNEAVREVYAPSPKYVRDLREKEKNLKLAWLSPFRDAVLASISDSNTPKGKKLDARRQIATVAQEVKIKELPEGITVVEEEALTQDKDRDEAKEETERQRLKREKEEERKFRENHFRIDLPYLGKDPNAVEKVEGALVKQLAVKEYKRLNTGDPTVLTYIAHRKITTDPLVRQGKGADWLDAHPAKSPKSLPIAVREDGSTVTLGTHHTLILGETGSGKGSPLQAMIRQLAPFVMAGTVKLHGVDYKATEFKTFKQIPGLFEEVIYDPEPSADLFSSLKEEMDWRTRSLGIDEEKMDAMRSIDPSREMPWHILFIDELWDGLDELGTKSTGYQMLNSIGRKGRSPGFFIVAATQSVEEKVMGNLRKHFVNKLPLRQESLNFNDFMLGQGAAAKGFDTTMIGASTPENGYAYAGIGYIKKGAAEPERIRHAYSDDKDIIPLAQKFRAWREGEAVASDDFASDDDGSFEMTSIESTPERPALEMYSFDEEPPLPRL